ncbi:MAG: glycerol-3-phosphate dehydrogenase, partial [Candidatus Marinamargulisbacteria bacterium]
TKIKISLSAYSHLVHTYGNAYKDILSIFEESPAYATPLQNGSHPLKGEVIYAIRVEMAQKIIDFMRRRSMLYFERQGDEDCLNDVAALFQSELNWTSEKTEQEKQNYKRYVKQQVEPSVNEN